MANFSTDASGDVASKSFASDTMQWPPGSGSADKELTPVSLVTTDGSTSTRVSTSNPLPVTDAGVGAVGDAAATAGSTGSLSAKLRLVTTQLASLITQLTAGATAVAKAIGAAAGATDVGIPPLAVRDDTLSTLSDPENDWVPLRVNSQGALHIAGSFSTTPASTGSTPTTVSVATTSTTILAANGNRRKLILINEGTVDVFLRYSAAASTTNYNEKLLPGQRLEMDNVTAVVNGVVASGTCDVRPTEFTV
jgi:hypothetical protein